MIEHNIQKTKSSLAHVVIELIFAVLPLVVFGIFEFSADEPHIFCFFTSPEWPMVACIIYGLTLVRLYIGQLNSKTSGKNRTGELAAIFIIFPLFGVIVSAILIGKAIPGTLGNVGMILQLVNFAISIILFIVLGGYGVSRAD